MTEIGILVYGDTPSDDPVEVASSGKAGQAIPLRVRTLDCGGDFEPVRMDIEYSESTVRATPYDCRSTGPWVLAIFSAWHEGQLVFDTPGTKRLEVIGQRVDDTGTDELIEIPYDIEIE